MRNSLPFGVTPRPFRRQAGYGLLEALLVAAAVLVIIAGIYRFYQQVNAQETAHQESQNTAEITNRMLRAYGTNANFANVNNSSAISDGVIPATMPVEDNTIRTGYGGNVVLSSETLNGDAGRGFSITYTNVPQKMCAQLVNSVNRLQRYHSISVRTEEAGETMVGENGEVDIKNLTNACSGDRVAVAFVYQRQDAGAQSTLDPCVLPSPASETRTAACPTGYVGDITQGRSASCASNYGLPAWSPWTEVGRTCQLICVPSPTSPETRTSTSCPTGQTGVITERRSSTCASQTASPVWSDWEVVGNTCATPCVAPAPEIRDVGCPTGQAGAYTQRRTASCPQPTGAYVWGPWQTNENTCQALCVLPNPATETKWVSTSGSCGAGYSGTATWEVEQRRSASCPTPTGSVSWTTWSNTGNTRNQNRSQCVALCTPAQPLEQWVAKTGTCPSGQTGSVTYEERQTRTSVCRPGASQPTTTAWAVTNETRNRVENCQEDLCAVLSSTTYSWTVNGRSCSANPSSSQILIRGGTIALNDVTPADRGTATFECVDLTVRLKTSSPTPVCGTPCTLAKGTVLSWTIAGKTCSAAVPFAMTANGGGYTPTLMDSTAPFTGYAAFYCTQDGVINGVVGPGASCN